VFVCITIVFWQQVWRDTICTHTICHVSWFIDMEMSVCKTYFICSTKTISCPVTRYLVSSLESAY